MTRTRRSRNRKLKAKRTLRVPQLPAVRMPRIRVNWKAVLLPPIAVAAAAAAASALQPLLDRPVGKLVIEGSFQRVTAVQIEAALAPELADGFLTLSLERLRSRVQSLPWVDAAQLRRTWPDTLVVHVTEHQAAARWRDTGLLNVRGELFAERPEHGFPELPKLAGPEGSEREVAALYLDLNESLAEAHLEIDSLSLDERGAWELVLATGQEVRLGRRDVEQRAERFFEVVAPALSDEFKRIDYVDLRYTNGFAVGWLEEAPDSAPDSAPEVAARPESAGRG